MVAKSFWRATALIILAAYLTTIQSSSVHAQKSDDLKTWRQQVQQLDQVGRYAEALALQRKIAVEVEKAETASGGKPGSATLSALEGVAWYGLLAHDFRTALAVSNRAHALAPTDVYVETNRAHALLLL